MLPQLLQVFISITWGESIKRGGFLCVFIEKMLLLLCTTFSRGDKWKRFLEFPLKNYQNLRRSGTIPEKSVVGRIHPCCVFVVVIALFLQKMHSNILQEYFSFDKGITTKYFAKIFTGSSLLLPFILALQLLFEFWPASGKDFGTGIRHKKGLGLFGEAHSKCLNHPANSCCDISNQKESHKGI